MIGKLCLGVSVLAGLALAADPTQCVKKGLALQILGSGGPISDDGRASSGTLLWIDGKAHTLIDAGGGTFLRFGQSGARLEDLKFMGLSHFHTDHVADVPALLKGSAFFKRTEPLHMVGPSGRGAFPGLTKFIDANFNGNSGAYAYLSGLNDGSNGLLPLKLSEVDIESKMSTKVYDNDGVAIYTKSVPHGRVPALAYRIETAGRRIVISPDQNGTEPGFVPFALDADILVMPAALVETADGSSRKLHAIPSQIGTIAAKSNSKVLVLNHLMGQSARHKEDVVSVVGKYFKRPLYAARDLSCYAMQ